MKFNCVLIIITLLFASSWNIEAGNLKFQKSQEEVNWEIVYGNILNMYVTETGLVNYKGLVSKKSQIESFLEYMRRSAPYYSSASDESLAYWINLYNAATLNLILNNYPVSSIMDINGGKAWDLKIVKVGDDVLSLNQIEHERIRPIFNEPRIHFAVNCAAKSCPKLLNEIYSSEKLEAQLERQTKYFINQSGKNTIQANSLSLSEIFEWYKDDFTKETSFEEFIKKYTATNFDSDPTITYNEYIWKLNEGN
ncbi:MAG: DUF547 domain-containing protein [Flavobacteriales bacterium]|nr:DUF547 domain-containing protein [Flavobacteriales bacterium]